MADGVVLEFYISEVLCFCKNCLGKVPKDEIVDVLVGFYDDKEIEKAKETLFNVVKGLSPKIDDLPRCPLRKEGNNKRRLDSDDLLTLVEFVDKKNVDLPPLLTFGVYRALLRPWWTLFVWRRTL